MEMSSQAMTMLATETDSLPVRTLAKAWVFTVEPCSVMIARAPSARNAPSPLLMMGPKLLVGGIQSPVFGPAAPLICVCDPTPEGKNVCASKAEVNRPATRAPTAARPMRCFGFIFGSFQIGAGPGDQAPSAAPRFPGRNTWKLRPPGGESPSGMLTKRGRSSPVMRSHS